MKKKQSYISDLEELFYIKFTFINIITPTAMLFLVLAFLFDNTIFGIIGGFLLYIAAFSFIIPVLIYLIYPMERLNNWLVRQGMLKPTPPKSDPFSNWHMNNNRYLQYFIFILFSLLLIFSIYFPYKMITDPNIGISSTLN